MSKSQSKIPSPARSQGLITPRRPRTRRTLSTVSPARSDMSGRLSSIVEKLVKDDFVLSPLKRRSVLPDDTEIEAPRRASWWKRLDGSSRDVLEALDTNKMTDDLMVEDYEFEVEKDKQNQSVPESSDNESVSSIIVPQRRLFNQKKEPQGKFADIMGSRKSLGKTNIEDESIEDAPRNLFNKGPRNKPVFPAALLNSTNKTINKTVDPEPTKQARPNLFGQAGTKRKNMFTDFVLSDSEDDSEVQHKVFGFKKNNNKRISLGTRNRRMPSLTPSMTTQTDIDIDDWNLLPSSTMIGAQEVSKMSIDDVERVQEENRDETLTEENESLNLHTNNRSHKKTIIDDENDITLTNENIGDSSKNQDTVNKSKRNNNTPHDQSKTNLNESGKDKSLQNKFARGNGKNGETIEEMAVETTQLNSINKSQINAMKEQSLEDKIAELHGENVDEEESEQNVLLNKTKEDQENDDKNNTANQHTYDKGEKGIKPSGEEQEIQNISKAASKVRQNTDGDVHEKEKRDEELEHTNERQENLNHSKKASKANQDEDMGDVTKKNKSGGVLELSVEEQDAQEQSKEGSNQDEDMEKEIEEEIEPTTEEQETRDSSEEVSHTSQNEDMNDMTEKDKSEEDIEPSANDDESQNDSNEEIDESEDEEMGDESEKDKSEEIDSSAHEDQSQNNTKEESHENQDEDMEEMVWNDNDDEKASDISEAGINEEMKQDNEIVSDQKGNKTDAKERTLERNEITNKSRNLTNKSKKGVESFVDNDQIEEDVVEETPNNSTHDTTGRNRKKEITTVNSPEAVLQNMTNDNESFRPIGRSTTFRKSKSLYETMHRPSLAPVQENTLGSEGSRNSSTEGSEWDSHRTTRKTIRQTLGKEYTTRKSLRALVMEQSAKRQTDHYNKNTSNINQTKNKTVLEGNDKNASKINKSKNKTVLEEYNNTAEIDKTKNRTVSKDDNITSANKTKNKTVLEEVNNKNASAMKKTKNKSELEDMSNEHIRFHRTSNRNISSNQSPISKSPVHGTSTHHVPDPLISELQVSYRKSLHDINDPEISEQISNREDSMDIPVTENNDSGPEISMNASYGQGMSADTAHDVLEKYEASNVEMKDNSGLKSKEVSRRNGSVRARSTLNSEPEILDYEASELEKSEQEVSESEVDQENLEQDNSVQESAHTEEKDNSEPEESESEVEEQSDNQESEDENEESQQEMEADSDQEDSQQEIEAESEHEESQQEMEAESEHEESQQEIESKQEESQQEEPESDQESDNDQDVSQAESDHEISRDSEDNEDFISGLNSQYQIDKRHTSRVVFDSQMMSVEEIDFEDVSKHTNDISEQSERDAELSRNTSSRISEPSVHEVSVGTKKSMLLMQMQKIAQQNMDLRQKIRDKVQKSLKPTRKCDIMSPVPKYSIRRMTKEPRQIKKKPKPTGVPIETLPKAFVEDLMYKPPKRFQPANAPWITKRLYTFLETKLEPKYDYRARVRAEELVQTIHSFSKLVRRRDVAPPQAVDELKREMARLRVVNTHYDFYEFFHDFMPREVRVKVNPDVVNNIPMPRNGVFGEILQPRTAAE